MLKTTQSPLLAARCLLEGLQLLGHAQLRKFVILPILVSLLLYSLAFALAYFYLRDVLEAFIPTWLHWLNWLLLPSLGFTVLVMGFFSFTLLANIISSPFYGQLAAKARYIINPQAETIPELPMLKVVQAELIRLAYILKRTVPLLILFIIPVVNFIAPVAWLLFSAWAIALEYMAYPLENEGVLFTEQRQLLKEVRWGALSFGGLTMLAFSVPVLNILAAPAAVIGATIYCHAIKNGHDVN
jgi:CysZ protein